MEKQNGAINQFLKPLSDLLDDFTISEIMIKGLMRFGLKDLVSHLRDQI